MSTLLAELENAGLVTTFEWDDEPETIRAQLEGLSSFPGDMSWDSYADFVEDVEDYDDAERVEQFLGLVGKHSLEAGTATVSVDTGNDAYAIGFAPKHSQQLKKAMRWITVVRRDTFT
ncbi:hypothetical protein [Nocardia sp. NPDC050710]|uniref:DUF6630 family protein n=1 Tax=Nocardia sp. NPDC050710 TaxID=3157220 RepID=UPI0033E83AF8